MTLGGTIPGAMQAQRRCQIRSEGLVDLVGELDARILAGDSADFRTAPPSPHAAIALQWRNASCSSTTSLMSPVGVVRQPRRARRTRSSAPWPASGRRSPAAARLQTPPTGAITNAVTPSAAVALTSLAMPARSEPGIGDDPDLASVDRARLGQDLHQCRRHGDVLGGLPFGAGRPRPAATCSHRSVSTLASTCEFAFLDGLLVDLAQLEGERLHDVGLFDRAQAAVEHGRPGRSGRRTRRLRAHRRALDHPRRLHVPAVLLIGGLRLVAVDAVGVIGRQHRCGSRSDACRRGACR